MIAVSFTGVRYGNLDSIAWLGGNNGNKRLNSEELWNGSGPSGVLPFGFGWQPATGPGTETLRLLPSQADSENRGFDACIIQFVTVIIHSWR